MTFMRKNTKESLDNLGIWTCDYPPQENKSGLAEYAADPSVSDGISQDALCTTNFDDYHANNSDIFANEYLNNLLDSNSLQDAEDATLETILQVIAENSHEMLPLLNLLREKSKDSTQISKLVRRLESKLSTEMLESYKLAPREAEVLELVAQGKSNSEIANILELQVITVGKTLTRVYRKLNAKNRADAVFKWSLMNIEHG